MIILRLFGLLLALSLTGACAGSNVRHQTAYGVSAAIVQARASDACAEVVAQVVNEGSSDSWVVISGSAPFFDPIDLWPKISGDSSDVNIRVSLAERVPASIPLHRPPPRQVRLSPKASMLIRIRISIPLKENSVQTAEYLGYEYPASEQLRNVVKSVNLPFWVRLNVGIEARAVDIGDGDYDDMWEGISSILKYQYIAETQSVRVMQSSPSFRCFPWVEILPG